MLQFLQFSQKSLQLADFLPRPLLLLWKNDAALYAFLYIPRNFAGTPPTTPLGSTQLGKLGCLLADMLHEICLPLFARLRHDSQHRAHVRSLLQQLQNGLLHEQVATISESLGAGALGPALTQTLSPASAAHGLLAEAAALGTKDGGRGAGAALVGYEVPTGARGQKVGATFAAICVNAILLGRDNSQFASLV